jgi:hypothetical protein
MLRVAVLVSIVVAVGTCARGGAGDGTTGVRGVALIGPTCPVEVEGSPCPPAPFSGEIEARGLDGRIVSTTTTAEDGTFELILAPGSYVITAVTPVGGPPTSEAQRVEVTARGFTRITLRLDSGIR